MAVSDWYTDIEIILHLYIVSNLISNVIVVFIYIKCTTDMAFNIRYKSLLKYNVIIHIIFFSCITISAEKYFINVLLVTSESIQKKLLFKIYISLFPLFNGKDCKYPFTD